MKRAAIVGSAPVASANRRRFGRICGGVADGPRCRREMEWTDRDFCAMASADNRRHLYLHWWLGEASQASLEETSGPSPKSEWSNDVETRQAASKHPSKSRVAPGAIGGVWQVCGEQPLCGP
eukprot:6203375-Pleurochrysis_carterae.AAC.2